MWQRRIAQDITVALAAQDIIASHQDWFTEPEQALNSFTLAWENAISIGHISYREI
jgi:hypothetical protein